MTSILHLITSPRGEASVSIKLGRTIIEKLQIKYPDHQFTEINLATQQVPHLEAKHLQSFFTPPDQQSAADLQSLKYSDEAISQLMNADIVIVGSPMYNFSIHSSLKAWIDQVARAGKTFSYTENGPLGLVTGKKVYLAVASGGIYSDGPFQSHDFVVPYLQSTLGFLGMTDLTVYRAEGLNIPNMMEKAWEQAIAKIEI